MNTMVIYHGPGCADGFTAAWVAYGSLGMGDDVRYVPMQYGDTLPAEIDNQGWARRVFLLDFSLPRGAMEFASALTEEVICLDHHKTAAQELDGLDGSRPGLKVVFDMGKSGAMLAWEYFHPGRPAPRLVELVQDRDLWTWKLENSREISAWLASHKPDFHTWTWAAERLEEPNGMAEIMMEGSAILRARDGHVNSLADKAEMINLAGHEVPVVNSPIFQSEIGERLCYLYPSRPFSVVYFHKAIDPHESVWSLRSRNGFDVSELARSLGGGGHPAAAGFTIKHGGPTQ